MMSKKMRVALLLQVSLLLVTLWLAPAFAAGPLYRTSTAAWNEHTYHPGAARRRRRRHSSANSVFGVGRGGHLLRTARPASYRQTRPSFGTRDYSSKVMEVEDFQRSQPKARLWSVNLKKRKPGKYSWTSKLVTLNILCYAIQVFWPRFTAMGVKLSDRILRGEQLYRLMTPVFLHGGVGHLAMNMFSLNNIGPNVEQLFGPGRYLSTYLVAGAAGNLASAINSPNPALGASGAIFGIVGAQLVFLTRNDWLLGRAGENMQSALLQTVLINVFVGAMNPMVDNWGHIGGLVGGAAAAYYFGPRLYLMQLPEGGRYVVDKPVVRLPPKIESIPERVARRFQRVTRRIRVNQHTSDLPNKPWRTPKPNYRQRQSTPNRSIKPRRFW